MKETTELLEILLSQADKKSQKKTYLCFIRTLSSLQNRNLTEGQLQLIHEKLSSLNLITITDNNKYNKQKFSEFKGFLKTEFSFTTEKHYTEKGIFYGLCLGTGIGLSTGSAINPIIGTGVGLSIGAGVGMLLGMMYSARKDADAKRQGRVL